jgi:MoaA/NifB/PqqE/SkfB family radical SAM enzyme
MHQDAFERLLERCGPFATNAVLYNYGEPLLNKKLPALIRRARGYGMTTHLSTNLSMKFDVPDFVRAQPDHIILSIDGITQETYGRFRKRGDLELVLSNVRAIVEEKQRLGLNRPILVWRFFPFEHNVHEVDDAIELAESMGVDEMIIGNPFDVSNDDPGVRLVECDRKGRYKFAREADLERTPQQILEGLEPNREVERLFDEGWVAQLSDAELDEPARRAENACRWLHYSMTLDAVGRVMPCCISPSRTKDLVYGDLSENEDWWNGSRFSEARLSLVDPAAYQAGRESETARGADAPGEPYCNSCPRRPAMTYGPANAWKDLCGLDFKQVALNLGEREWWQFAETGA